jgi:hypothetical protein
MVAVAAVAVVAALVTSTSRWTSNRVVIKNRSGATIVSMTVTVGGRSVDFPPIAPGATVEAPYWVHGDDSFALAGRLSDGTQFGGGFGYVTNGMYGDVARFVIEPGGKVTFSQGP